MNSWRFKEEKSIWQTFFMSAPARRHRAPKVTSRDLCPSEALWAGSNDCQHYPNKTLPLWEGQVQTEPLGNGEGAEHQAQGQ